MLVTYLLALAVVLLGVACLTLFRRASQARRELAQEGHDRALALDRRCDFLQEQLDAFRGERQLGRIDHLFALVSSAQAAGVVGGEPAMELRRYVLRLRDELIEGKAEERAAS